MCLTLVLIDTFGWAGICYLSLLQWQLEQWWQTVYTCVFVARTLETTPMTTIPSRPQRGSRFHSWSLATLTSSSKRYTFHSTASASGFVTSVGKRCALPLITVFLVTKTLLSTQFNVNSNVCCMLLSNWNNIDLFRGAWMQGLGVCSRVDFLFEFHGND